MDEHFDRNEIYSRAVRAGKRTYFFDVKSTRGEEYYLTITESKRRFQNEDGRFSYEKHKLFLYKEDFEKFMDGLTDAITYIKNEQEVVERGPSSGLDSTNQYTFGGDGDASSDRDDSDFKGD